MYEVLLSKFQACLHFFAAPKQDNSSPMLLIVEISVTTIT